MSDDMPNILIWIVKETLSDGSEVFNVEIPEASLPAITADDAAALAETIAGAINEHSNETAGTMQ